MQIVLINKQATSFEKQETNFSGEVLYSQITLSPVFDLQGNIKNIVAIKSDISELVKTKEEIKREKEVISKQKEKIEDINNALSQSISYATRIQQSILPDFSIIEENTAEYFVMYMPKNKVSGDFYWWEKIENNLVVTVSDCTGHGIPGAFMSMLGISYLREIVLKEYVTQPNVILNKLRKEIIKSLKQKDGTGKQKDGMDMALISLNLNTYEMMFAGANNSVYIVTKRDTIPFLSENDIYTDIEPVETNHQQNSFLFEIKPDKMPVGIYIKMNKYTLNNLTLEPGDKIYLFSDGFSDQFGGVGFKKFKSNTFRQLILSISNKPMNEQNSILSKTIGEWKGKHEQTDDITVLGLML
jgi:serine phosphatase RsbU (regulator of sigma subunit)